jgi:sugar lactone lactonase YvrE
MSAALCLAALAAAISPDSDPPQARIDFPLPSALTDAATMRVRGSASDPDGVAAVRVNGMPASTVDGFATWWVVVPLELGESELVVEAVDALGNLDPKAATTVVRRDDVIVWRPFDVTVAPSGDRCAIVEEVTEPWENVWGLRLSLLDLSTNEIRLLSSKSKGSGPWPYSFREIEFDPHAPRLLVTTSTFGAVLAVDLMTGDRSVVSGPGVGDGPQISSAYGLAVDPSRARAWVGNYTTTAGGGAIIEVDLRSGDRKLIANATHGNGPWPGYVTGAELNPTADRLLVCSGIGDEAGVLAIELDSGDRSWVSTAANTLGPSWMFPQDVAVGPAGAAWVSDFTTGRMFAVDLVTGANRLVTAREHPLGSFVSLFGIDLDAHRGRILAADYDSGGVLALDLGSAELSMALRNSIGVGPGFRKAGAIELLEPDGSRLVVTDQFRHAVQAVDLTTGARSVLSGPDHGSGPELVGPVDVVALDSPEGKSLLVLDTTSEALVRVDIQTGNRTLVSGDGVGAGVPLNLPWVMVHPAHEDRVIVSTGVLFDPSLIEVDLSTGDRTVFSDANHGSGPELVNVGDMDVDSASNRIYVAAIAGVFAVDLATGDRTVVSDAFVGSGPPFSLFGPHRLLWDPVQAKILALDTPKGLFRVDPASGDRELVVQAKSGKGPGMIANPTIEILRPSDRSEPLLLFSDWFLGAIGVLDLAVDPTSGEVPAWRAIVSR